MKARRSVVLLSVIVALAAGCATSQNSLTKKPDPVGRVVWRSPIKSDLKTGGDGGLQIAWLSRRQIAVLSARTRRDKPQHPLIRIVDLSGKIHKELDLGPRGSGYDLVGINTQRDLIAVNNMDDGFHPLLISLADGRTLDLGKGQLFPITVIGNGQPFDPSGRYALTHRVKDSSHSMSVVDVTSGKQVRRVSGFPTAKGPLIRWVGHGEHPMRWFDPISLTLDGEQPNVSVASKGINLPFRKSESFGMSLSLDASTLAAFSGQKGRMHVALYEASSGRLIANVTRRIKRNETVSCALWSPDGKSVAIGLTDEQNVAGGSSAYLISTSGTVREIRVPGSRIVGSDAGIAWSPDSRQLALIVHPESMDLLEGSLFEALAVVDVGH